MIHPPAPQETYIFKDSYKEVTIGNPKKVGSWVQAGIAGGTPSTQAYQQANHPEASSQNTATERLSCREPGTRFGSPAVRL